MAELKGLGMLRSKAVFVNVAAHFFCTHWHSKIEFLQPFGRVGLVFKSYKVAQLRIEFIYCGSRTQDSSQELQA